MAKAALRQKATELRLLGYTYSQIKKELGIEKSTLSGWLNKLPLTAKQLELLSKNRDLSRSVRIERYRQTIASKRLARYKKVFEEESKKILPLTKKELLMAGLFLYWGEGAKQKGVIAISNANPLIIQFAKYWMTKILGVPSSKLRVRLHLYSDMNVEETQSYWSKKLRIPIEQFKNPYIKTTKREGITYKSFGHGTCNLMCFDTILSERVAMSIRAIAEYCGAKSDDYWYN